MKRWVKGQIYAQYLKTSCQVIRLVKATAQKEDDYIGVCVWSVRPNEKGERHSFIWDKKYEMIKAPPVVQVMYEISLDEKD